jgi:hypothetical protein
MPLSYTQNMEDYHLAIAFEGLAKGFYVDDHLPCSWDVSSWSAASNMDHPRIAQSVSVEHFPDGSPWHREEQDALGLAAAVRPGFAF